MVISEQQSSGLDNYKGVIIDGKCGCMGFQSNHVKIWLVAR